MKNHYKLLNKLLLLGAILLLLAGQVSAQYALETFEESADSATSFTSNGRSFTITTLATAGLGNFQVPTLAVSQGLGWNGTTADNRFVDNSGGGGPVASPASFSISDKGAHFVVKSFWLFLSDASLNQSVSGSVTVIGILGGVQQFSISSGSGFNQNMSVANGFSLIDLSTFGGSDNSNKMIDSLVIATGGSYTYVSFDAFKWAPFNVTSSQTNVSCYGGNNGTATVSPSGGAPPYSYTWSPQGGTAASATGIAAGNYTCTVTDASGAWVSTPATINQPPNITIATSQTNVSTYGGSDGTATVIVTGGTPSYTYSWAPSGGTGATASGLTAGSYNCTVMDENSCSTQSANILITQPAAPPVIAPDANGIIYVTQTGAGNKSGNSWANAANDFQSAINATGVKQVWVAAGTYQPASGQSFSMKEGVKIYGGFAGTETSFSQRNLSAYRDTLKGNGNSVIYNNNNGLDTSAVLDGFIITGGSASRGGGMHNYMSSPMVSNCIFLGNTASGFGGGMGIEYSTSYAVVINCIFSGNGAGYFGGGGIGNNYSSSPVEVINCTFSGNTSLVGGSDIMSVASSTVVTNSIMYSGNDAVDSYNGGWPIVNYSLVQGGYSGTGNINADPLFVDAATGNYQLLAGSPAINKGNNDSIPVGITTDIAGNPRIQKGTVDMGAYESPYMPLSPDANGIVYVTPTGAGNNTGNSWANATNDLQMAMDADSVKQVWVAGGTYKPIYPADSLNTVDSTNRDDAFVLQKGVKVYGGFAGTETALSQRDLTKTANASILSGDIGIVNDSIDNAYHVVISAGDVDSAELNGFRITGGNANDAGNSDPIITVNTQVFSRNFGGGIMVTGSSPTIANCILSGNTALHGGGAICIDSSGQTTITNSYFYNNTSFDGSTMGSGGGLQINSLNPGEVPIVNITNCVFANNRALGTQDDGGGAMTLYGGTVNCSGVTFYNNTTASTIKPDANTISTMAGSTLNMNNSIIWGNATQQIHNLGTASITYSDIQGGYAGAGNISKYPQFKDTTHNNFSLKIVSPVINAGSNQLFPVPNGGLNSALDIAGNPRVYHYSTGGIIDMGAYEFQGNPIDYSNIGFADSTLGYNGSDQQYKAAHIPDSIATVTYTVRDSDSQVVTEAMALGKYTIEAAFKIADGTVGLDTTVTLIIQKGTITGISFNNSTITYDGSSHALAISGTLPAGTSVTYSSPVTEAGTYTDTAFIVGGNNYNNDTLTARLTIEKATSTGFTGVTFSDSTVTYDGNSHALAISGTLPPGVSVSYRSPKTDAGIYTDTAYITGGNNYENDTLTAQLTIGKAAITGITLNNATVTYDGNSHVLAISGVLPAGASVSYSSPKTDAGIYTDTAYIVGGNNYNNDTLTARLTIEKATSTGFTGITFNNSEVTYDGNNHSLTISGTLPAGASVSYSSPKTNAGIYTDTAYIAGGNNYNNDTLTAQLTIGKATITGITLNNATVIYDGNSHVLAISGTLPAGTSISYSSPKTDAGIYTDTAYLAGGNNYENDTLTAQLTIGKATITGITLNNATVIYDGNSHALAISGTLPAGASVSYSSPKTNAGIYTDTAYIAGGNNYNNDTLTAQLTIGKATVTGITLNNATVIYDGNSHVLAISGTLPAGVSVSYSSPMIEAGTYTDMAYLAGGNNYENDTLTAKLTIGNAAITNNISFKDVTVTYDGSSHSVTVDENTLPKGVTISGYDNNDQTNAGTYTVTAHLSGGNNYNDKDITATLTINKTPQTITFNAIPVKSLENDAGFQLQATASSGLPVTYSYSYTAPAPPATVTPDGFVKLQTSGLITITASQAGNNNYLPATEVVQTLQINSSNASIFDIQVGDTTASNPSDSIYYQVDCHNSTESVSVTITAEANAIVTPGRTFVIQTPKPGIYTQQVTVTSQDGSTTKDYTITVNKAFSFNDIVVQKFNNVLLVNNNPATNGGYQFVSYKWYKNGVLVGTGPYYSAGNEINDQLDNTAVYSVVLTTANGEVLHTCGGVITLTSLFDATLSPNPAAPGGTITLTVTLPPAELAQMRISIFTLTGNLIKTIRSSDEITNISLSPAMIPGTYIVKCETPDFHKSFKLIVQ